VEGKIITLLRKKLKSLGYITVYVEYLKAFEWSVLPTLLMDPIRNQLCKCRSFDTTFKASVEVESQMPWSFLFSRQMTTLTELHGFLFPNWEVNEICTSGSRGCTSLSQ
jgi:hypothetical protein